MAHYAVTKNGEHDPGCRYDFKNRAERIILDSRGSVVHVGDMYELIVPSPDKIEPPDRLPSSKPGRPRARLQVSSSTRTLTPALGSAARILRLLRDFDDDPDAANRFRARYAGKKITWPRFCRNMTETTAIASLLPKFADIQHPLAFHGTVGTIDTIGSGDTYQLSNDHHTGLVDHAGRQRRIRVVVRSKNPDTFTHVQPGDRWLGFGHWNLWTADRAPIAELKLWIDGPWSLATWHD